MKPFYLLLFGILIALNLSAQQFKPGKIVLLDGTEKKGLIQINEAKINSNYCYFKESKNTGIVTYHPTDIEGYSINSFKIFYSKTLPNSERKVFLEYLVDGKVDLFTYTDDKEKNNFFIQKNGELISVTSNKKMVEKDGKQFQIQDQQFKTNLKQVFSDAFVLHNEISITNYNLESLVSLTKKYHNLTCKDTLCIDYSRNKVKSTHFEIVLNPAYGLVNFAKSSAKPQLFYGFGFNYYKKDLHTSSNIITVGFNYLFENIDNIFYVPSPGISKIYDANFAYKTKIYNLLVPMDFIKPFQVKKNSFNLRFGIQPGYFIQKETKNEYYFPDATVYSLYKGVIEKESGLRLGFEAGFEYQWNINDSHYIKLGIIANKRFVLPKIGETIDRFRIFSIGPTITWGRQTLKISN